ncbi:MAG: DMT family transporter [Myxococcales bacterium]|nr:DMT family transporter [Myxococcales bacterium]
MAALFAAAFLIPFRQAIEYAPHFSVITAMFVVATVFNGCVMVLRPSGPPRIRDRDTIVTAVALAVCTVAGNVGVALALPLIGAGMTSVILKAQVIITPFLVWWVFKETPTSRLWVGVSLSLVGCIVPHWSAGSDGDGHGYGWALLAALGFASMQILTRKVIHRVQTSVVNMLRLLVTVFFLHLIPEGRAAWMLPLWVWLLAGTAGLFGPGMSRLCLMGALRYMSPSHTALVALVGPVFAFILGYVFLQEIPSGTDILGSLLIFAGVVWVLLPRILAVMGEVSGERSRPGVQGSRPEVQRS